MARVAIDTNTDATGTVRIPSSWVHVSEGQNSGLGLATAPRAELIDGVVDGNRVTSLTGIQDLRLDDVFVEVWVNDMLAFGGFEGPAIPTAFDPADFEPSGQKFGEPINEFVAEGPDGRQYVFRYWAGPEASEEDRQTMLDVIRSMRFPDKK